MRTQLRPAEATLPGPVALKPVPSQSRIIWTDTAKLGLVLLVALVQGLLYLWLVPPWQHYDEPTHFEYARLMADRLRRPAPGDVDFTLRREIAASMLQFGFYRDLPTPDLLADDGEIWIGISELGHPPLYYTLVALPLRLARYLDVTTQLYLARTVSLVLFLLTIWVGGRLMRDLAPPAHGLRWTVPLAVALLPPFADLMTSVNNDVGAVLFMSCFLWGAVRTIRYGVSLRRLIWLTISALAAVMTKNTAALALPLIPLVVVASLGITRPRLGRRLLAATLLAVVLMLPLMLDGGDAASWYRWEQGSTQETATRLQVTAAPYGQHAIVREVTEPDRAEYLLNPVPHADVRRIAGRTITLGGWLWADQAARTDGLGIVFGLPGRVELTPVTHPVTLTTTPTFVHRSYRVPSDAAVLHFALFANPNEGVALPLRIMLDGAMLVEGELPVGVTPTFADASGQLVVWSGGRARNLVRNPSGEEASFRLRPSLDRLLLRYARRSPSQAVSGLMDWRRTAPILLRQATPEVINSFFGSFGWGGVRVTEHYLGPALQVLVVVTLVGSVAWLVGGSGGRRKGIRAAVMFLGFAACLSWIGAITRPLPMLRAFEASPAARYAFPVVLPTMLMLVGGWRALWPRRLRQWGVGLLLFGLMLLDLVALAKIHGAF